MVTDQRRTIGPSPPQHRHHPSTQHVRTHTRAPFSILFNISFLVKLCNPFFCPMSERSYQREPSLMSLSLSLSPLSLSSDTVHRALIKERSGASIRPSTQPTEPQSLVWKHLAPALIRTLLLPLNQVKNKTNKQNENKDKCLCGN